MSDKIKDKLSQQTLGKIQDPSFVKQAQNEGKTYQELIGFTSDEMNKFYQFAVKLYQEKKIDDASDVFYCLTVLNPYMHNAWICLGITEQMKQNFECALYAYSMAMVTHSKNPYPYLLSVECYLQLNLKEEALSALDIAFELLNKNDHPELRQKALALKEQLNKPTK